MLKRLALTFLLIGIGGAGIVAPAHADIYTWIDAKGITNVSNIAPPDGVSVKNVVPSPPKDPAREVAMREAAQQAEMQALNERVAQLQMELEQTRPAYPPIPPMAYAPPQPTVVVVQSPPMQYPAYAPQPAYDVGPMSGCDYGFNCGWWGPGFYGTTIVTTPRGKFNRRFGPPSLTPRPIVPPLVPPLQPAPRVNVSYRHR